MFFNELDLLEIRLNELDKVVDKFIISESAITHAGEPKPLYFEENKNRFNKFLHKIEYILIDNKDIEGLNSAWEIENFQRNILAKKLSNCNDNDIIIISDLDEIPRADLIQKYKDTEGIKVFEQKLYTFYFNYLNETEPNWKRGTRLLKFKDIGNKTLTDIRMLEGQYIKNGGWHFTYLGGIQTVKNKVRSFAHQEYNNEYYMNDKRLERLIQDGADIFERGYKYKIVGLNSSFPEYVRKNRKKFRHLILEKSPLIHRIKNTLIRSKQQDKRYVDTYQPINDNPIKDFISPTSSKILNVTQDINIDTLPDNYYDCAIFDNTLGVFHNPQEVLTKLHKKLNRNGYVIMTIPNFRNIKVLNQILFKKTFIPQENQLRFFTRKNLFELITKSGYYLVTFKGLKPVNTLDYRVKNILMAGNLYDCKHEEFLCVIKG